MDVRLLGARLQPVFWPRPLQRIVTLAMLGSSDEGAFATTALSYAGGFLLRVLSTSTEA